MYSVSCAFKNLLVCVFLLLLTITTVINALSIAYISVMFSVSFSATQKNNSSSSKLCFVFLSKCSHSNIKTKNLKSVKCNITSKTHGTLALIKDEERKINVTLKMMKRIS